MGPELVDHLTYDKEDTGILWIRFNRPERLNALFGRSEVNGTVAKVGEYMRAADDDNDIRVIVLTGVGRAFCAGADLKHELSEEETGPVVAGARTTEVGPDGPLLIVSLVVLMVVKFLFVILFFMHLRFDSRLFSLVFYIGLVFAIVLYGVMLATFHFFVS